MPSHSDAGLWPVVQRELRESARRPLNHWLRLGGAVGGVAMLVSVTAHVPVSVVGRELFNYIHVLLLCLICALVPALTADCIARERREGTLGLLFMTPLTASGIVMGKVLAQVLRALTLWLALMPLLAIPFLYGGITWNDIGTLLTVELCAAMLSLAAGMLASSFTDSRPVAFILAFLLMGIFVHEARAYTNVRMAGSGSAAFATGPPANLATFYSAFASGSYTIPPAVPRFAYNGRIIMATNRVWSGVGTGPMLLRVGPGSLGAPLVVTMYAAAPPFSAFAFGQFPPGLLVESFLLGTVVLLVSIRVAGWRVETSWQDKTPSLRQEGLVKRYCSPIFRGWFARGMRRTLEWNPIAWLQQYSWKARLSKWGLCLLFVVLLCTTVKGDNLQEFSQILLALLGILVAAYTFACVNGFLQEKKTGALELILVSPISVNQIISGRVWGLWKQFLPSTLVLIGSDVAFHSMIGHLAYYGGFGPSWGIYWLLDLEIFAIYLTLPVVATCFALTSRNLFVASALTIAIVFGPAALMLFSGPLHEVLASLHLTWGSRYLLNLLFRLVTVPFAGFAMHALSARMAFRHLQVCLRRRSYAY